MNLTPQQRLATSRRAIVQSMNQDRREHRNDGGDKTFEDEANKHRLARQRPSGLNGLWRMVRRAASAWWQSHPAHLAMDVAHPMIEKYAQANPLKLLGLAAAVGAVVVIAKPWRLISVTGLVVAAFRSTQMSNLIASVLSSPPARP